MISSGKVLGDTHIQSAKSVQNKFYQTKK